MTTPLSTTPRPPPLCPPPRTAMSAPRSRANAIVRATSSALEQRTMTRRLAVDHPVVDGARLVVARIGRSDDAVAVAVELAVRGLGEGNGAAHTTLLRWVEEPPARTRGASLEDGPTPGDDLRSPPGVRGTNLPHRRAPPRRRPGRPSGVRRRPFGDPPGTAHVRVVSISCADRPVRVAARRPLRGRARHGRRPRRPPAERHPPASAPPLQRRIVQGRRQGTTTRTPARLGCRAFA